MEIMHQRIGLEVTGTAAIEGTATSVEIDAAPMEQVMFAGIGPVGSSTPENLSQFQLQETISGDRHFVSGGKVTVGRSFVGSVTSQDVTFQYLLKGF